MQYVPQVHEAFHLLSINLHGYIFESQSHILTCQRVTKETLIKGIKLSNRNSFLSQILSPLKKWLARVTKKLTFLHKIIPIKIGLPQVTLFGSINLLTSTNLYLLIDIKQNTHFFVTFSPQNAAAHYGFFPIKFPPCKDESLDNKV